MDAKDKASIETLLKITRICGTFPSQQPSRWCNIYQFVIFLLNILFSIYSICNNARLWYSRKTTMDTVLELLTSFTALLQGSSIQFSSLWCPNGWRQLYADLIQDDCCNNNNTKKLGVYFEIFIAHVFILTKIFYVLWIWIPLIGFEITSNYIFRPINEYYTLISIMLLMHVNTVIRKKFVMVNQILKRTKSTRYIQTVYTRNVRLIDSFNCVFGYQILFLMAHTIATILECLYSSLFHDVSETGYKQAAMWHGVQSITTIVIKLQFKKKNFQL